MRIIKMKNKKEKIFYKKYLKKIPDKKTIQKGYNNIIQMLVYNYLGVNRV